MKQEKHCRSGYTSYADRQMFRVNPSTVSTTQLTFFTVGQGKSKNDNLYPDENSLLRKREVVKEKQVTQSQSLTIFQQ